MKKGPYDLMQPCSNCPFLKKGGIRLTQGRIRELCDNMLSPDGVEFYCHKTTGDCEDEGEDGERYMPKKGTKHCAGALIFAERNKNATQMMRIAERLRLYEPKKLMSDKKAVNAVASSTAELLRLNRVLKEGPI